MIFVNRLGNWSDTAKTQSNFGKSESGSTLWRQYNTFIDIDYKGFVITEDEWLVFFVVYWACFLPFRPFMSCLSISTYSLLLPLPCQLPKLWISFSCSCQEESLYKVQKFRVKARLSWTQNLCEVCYRNIFWKGPMERRYITQYSRWTVLDKPFLFLFAD